MKKIKLTQNKFALVDDDDFEEVSKYKWYLLKASTAKTYYVYRNALENGRGKSIYLHQQVMGEYPLGKTQIDHKDMDGLNNQKSNLRFTTSSENKLNRNIQSNNKSGYKGVYKFKNKQGNERWTAQFRFENKKKWLGTFRNPLDASKAYNTFIGLNYKDLARQS